MSKTKTAPVAKKPAAKAKTDKVVAKKPAPAVEAPAAKIPKGGSNIVNLPVEAISLKKNFNPRTDVGDLKELKASLREHGVISPITVCPTKEGADTYYVVAGERRFSAWKEMGKANISAVVRTDFTIDSAEAFNLAMSENSDEARTPLSADDLTSALTKMLEQAGGEGHEAEVAKVCGYSSATVKRALRYALVPKTVRAKVAAGDFGRTVALATLDIPEEVREKVIGKIGAGTTERDVRMLANEAKVALRAEGTDTAAKTKSNKPSRHNVPFGQDETKVATPRGSREAADARRKLTALVLNCEADVEEAKTTDEQVEARVALTAAKAALAALYWVAGISDELIEQVNDTTAVVALDDKSFLAALERGTNVIKAAAEEAQAKAEGAEAAEEEEEKAEKSAKKVKTVKIVKKAKKAKAKAKAAAADEEGEEES